MFVWLTFPAEGLLEETFGYNFLQEVQAQGLIGVSARAAQPQRAAASYQSTGNFHALFTHIFPYI